MNTSSFSAAAATPQRQAADGDNKQHNTSSSSPSKNLNTKILDHKRLRVFSGDDTLFVVRTNNNANDKNNNNNSSDDDEDDNNVSSTMMMLMMLQQQQSFNSMSPPSSSSPGGANNNTSFGAASGGGGLLSSQSVWHVSNIVNLHLPGLLWSDPESCGKWQRWLLRAIPEMVNLTRIDVRDGQMGDLWCRALIDALTEQRINAAQKRAAVIDTSMAFSPRFTSANNNNNKNGPSSSPSSSHQDIFVMHLENNFLTQHSSQHIGRFLSTVASSNPPKSSSGFLVELYLHGNPKIGDHGAQMLAAHAGKAATIHEVSNRVVMRFLDISGCDVGGRGLSDLMTNCGSFCSAIISEGWRHYHQGHQDQTMNAQQKAMTSTMMFDNNTNNHQQQQQVLPSPPPTIYSRDAMRNIPAVSSLRVLDLSGCGYHRMGSTALNVLLPALLVCCPQLRALGMANTISLTKNNNNNTNNNKSKFNSNTVSATKPSELIRGLIDSLTSICRSCQRAPSLEFLDLSGCHVSDQSILKLIEFITREKARERAAASSSSSSTNTIGNFLHLKIIDVSDGTVLPDGDKAKAPITIGGGAGNNNNSNVPTQLHVRSSLGKDVWRAVMLGAAMEDDQTLDVITKTFASSSSDTNNNNNNNSFESIRQYVEQVTASPSSRYARHLRRTRSANRAEGTSGGNASSSNNNNNNNTNQQLQDLQRQREEAIMNRKVDQQQYQQEQEQKEKEQKATEKEKKRKLQMEQHEQRERELLQQKQAQTARIQQQQQREEEEQQQRKLNDTASTNLPSLSASPIVAPKHQNKNGGDNHHQAAGGGGGGSSATASSSSSPNNNNNNNGSPSPSAASNTNNNNNHHHQGADRALDFDTTTNNNNNNAGSSQQQQQQDHQQRQASVESISAEAKTVLDAAVKALPLSLPNRSFTFTLPHDPNRNPLLCCAIPLIAGGAPASPLFSQLLLADLQTFINAEQKKTNAAEKNQAVAVEQVKVFLDGTFAVTAKTSARRHVADHLLNAAFSKETEGAFPRLSRVIYNLWKENNNGEDEGESSENNKIIMLPDGTTVPCPKIGRCSKHNFMPLELSAPPPLANGGLGDASILFSPDKNINNGDAAMMLKNNSINNNNSGDDDTATSKNASSVLGQKTGAGAPTEVTATANSESQQQENEGEQKDNKAAQQQQQQQSLAPPSVSSVSSAATTTTPSSTNNNKPMTMKEKLQMQLEAKKKERLEAAEAAKNNNNKTSATESNAASSRSASDANNGAAQDDPDNNKPSAEAEGGDNNNKARSISQVSSSTNATSATGADDGASPSPPPPPAAAPPAKSSNDDNSKEKQNEQKKGAKKTINVFNFEQYAKRSSGGGGNNANPSLGAASSASSSGPSSYRITSSPVLSSSLEASLVANNNKPYKDVFNPPPRLLSGGGDDQEDSSSSSKATAMEEETALAPPLKNDAQNKRCRLFFEICLNALRASQVILDDSLRNKRRVFSGWMADISNEGVDRESGEAPRIEKQEVVINIEWNDFLVIKTCHSAIFDVSRALKYVHPLIGNSLAGLEVPLCRSASVAGGEPKANSSGDNDNTNNNNADSVVLSFGTPRGNVHVMNIMIDPAGFGEAWPEEVQNPSSSSNNNVLRVIKRLKWAIAASSSSDSLWPVKRFVQ